MNMCFSKEPAATEIEVSSPLKPDLANRSWVYPYMSSPNYHQAHIFLGVST